MVSTDTTVKCPSIHPSKTILGITSSSSEKWIAQFGFPPTSATSFSATRLAQARNGEQEAKENQNVMIRLSSSGSTVHVVRAAVPVNLWAASSWTFCSLALFLGSHLDKLFFHGNKGAVSSSGSTVHVV